MESLMKINDPILLALIATGFTWFMTALGAAMVFFFKEINKRVLNMMLGFAAGIMVAASFWSLLAPAIEMAEKSSLPAWLVAAIGFLSGAAFLWLADRILPHAHFFAKEGEVEGIPTNWRRSILLVFSITLHNIPEGLAVGVAFGAAANSMSETGLLAAVAVALGIGIQNFPEGAAVSIPLRARRCFADEKFYVWPGFRAGRTDSWCYWCGDGYFHGGYFAVCLSLCCRRYAVCRCRRVDTGVSKWWRT